MVCSVEVLCLDHAIEAIVSNKELLCAKLKRYPKPVRRFCALITVMASVQIWRLLLRQSYRKHRVRPRLGHAQSHMMRITLLVAVDVFCC